MCDGACVFDRFGALARLIVEFVGSCIQVQPQHGGGFVVDLNDMRYERLLKARKIKTTWWFEELVLFAVGVFKNVIGVDGIMFEKYMLDECK